MYSTRGLGELDFTGESGLTMRERHVPAVAGIYDADEQKEDDESAGNSKGELLRS